MAFRTWAKLLGATLGVAALAGASQLGLAYGLGILRLTRVLDVPTRDQWTAQLAWVAWFAMMAAVLGGLAGGWLLERWRGSATIATHIALSLAAGVGAGLVVPLTMQPARTAQIAGVHPVFVIGLCAGLGALAGAFAAYAALTQVVARWSLGIFGVLIWVIAIVAVVPSLAPSDPLPATRLGVFDAGFAPSITQRTALFTMPALALLVGAALGWTARRREMPTLTIALAGLPGPALLTLAYLIAGPGSGNERYQVVPYWAAMTATGAGVLGSVLAAVLFRSDEGTGDLAPDEEEKTEATTPSPVTPPGPPEARIPDQRTPTAPVPDRPAPDEPTSEWPATESTSEWPATGSTPADRPSADPTAEWPGTGSTSQWPATGHRSAGDDPAPTDPGPSAGRAAGWRARAADALGRAGATRSRTPGPATAEAPLPEPRTPNAPEWTRPAPPEQPGPVSLGEYTQREPAPFDAFAPAATRRNSTSHHAAAEPQPYVPAPAIPPMPPGITQEPQTRSAGGRLSRGRNPFSRTRANPQPDAPGERPEFLAPPAEFQAWPGRTDLPEERPPSGAPLVPEPHAVSAPLPHPDPITPPLTVTPAPEPDQRRGRKKGRDDDYVDWVSGLGN